MDDFWRFGDIAQHQAWRVRRWRRFRNLRQCSIIPMNDRCRDHVVHKVTRIISLPIPLCRDWDGQAWSADDGVAPPTRASSCFYRIDVGVLRWPGQTQLWNLQIGAVSSGLVENAAPGLCTHPEFADARAHDNETYLGVLLLRQEMERSVLDVCFPRCRDSAVPKEESKDADLTVAAIQQD